MISNLERFIKWFDDGIPTDVTATTIEEIIRQANENTILSGVGSPEGAITANPKAVYMDELGTAGNILYVKKSGTGNTGWILI